MAFAGFGLGFFGGIVFQYGNITLFEGRSVDWAAVLGFLIGLAGVLMLAAGFFLLAAGIAMWILQAVRLHRIDDPWAHDPDIDGPDPTRRHDLDDLYDEVPPGS